MNTSKKTLALSSLTLRILTLGCFATAAFFGLRSTWSQPPQLLPTVTADSSSFVPSIQSPPSLETQNIEDIRLGQRVVGTNPLREQTQPASDINPATWRAVELVMHEAGIQYDLAFLRPLSWIETTGAVEGGTIHIELDEMGLNGPAQVTAINPCPEIEADDGTGRNVVTGTMAHPGDNILFLDITGLDEPLGVTDTHPIWSETRQGFVKASQLEIGEELRSLTGGSATLTAIHPHRGPPEMVFNLEVDADHVYAVAGSGLLVHNNCVDWVRKNADEIGGEAVYITPRVGNYVGRLPGYEYGPGIRGDAIADEAHAFIIRGGEFFDKAHPRGTSAAQWFGQFMDDNNIDSIGELLYEIDFNRLTEGIR